MEGRRNYVLGLFEWSMKHADGTRVADMRQIEVDPQKMAWLQEVLSNYVKDLVKRLREIKVALEQPENQNIGLEEQEALLDELQEIVEDIDQAKSGKNFLCVLKNITSTDLHIIGGVPLLIDLLQSSEVRLKWRAAEIVASCTQNHSEIQKARDLNMKFER